MVIKYVSFRERRKLNSMLSNFLFSINVVLPLFICCFVGYIARQFRLVNENFITGCSNLVFYFALPASVFMSLMNADLKESFNIRLMVYLFGVIIVLGTILVLVVPRLIRNRAIAATAVLCMFQSNYALVGIPLAISLMGQEAAAPTLIAVPFATLLYTVLMILILVALGERKNDYSEGLFRYICREIYRNPIIIASAASILVALMHLPLPTFIETSISYFANSCTALSLFMLGAQLDITEVRSRLKYTIPISIFRLVIIPAVTIIVATLLGFRGAEMGCVLIFFAAPTSINCYVLSSRMGGDGKVSGDAVLLTSCFSCITLVFAVFILRSLALL